MDNRIKKSPSSKIIAFMNSYTQGISGGDICFIEIAKRINHYNKIVVTSLLGKRVCESKGLNANYLLTTKEPYFQKVIFTYIKRIFKALYLKIDISEGDILYSTSDFLPDVIPAFVRKVRKRKVKWIQKTFHLISSDRLIPNCAQKFSFFLIKRFAD